MVEQIGINAGKVWSILDETGYQNVKELKKVSKLIYNDLYAALGWLAREGKIVLEIVDKEQFVGLA